MFFFFFQLEEEEENFEAIQLNNCLLQDHQPYCIYDLDMGYFMHIFFLLYYKSLHLCLIFLHVKWIQLWRWHKRGEHCHGRRRRG